VPTAHRGVALTEHVAALSEVVLRWRRMELLCWPHLRALPSPSPLLLRCHPPLGIIPQAPGHHCRETGGSGQRYRHFFCCNIIATFFRTRRLPLRVEVVGPSMPSEYLSSFSAHPGPFLHPGAIVVIQGGAGHLDRDRRCGDCEAEPSARVTPLSVQSAVDRHSEAPHTFWIDFLWSRSRPPRYPYTVPSPPACPPCPPPTPPPAAVECGKGGPAPIFTAKQREWDHKAKRWWNDFHALIHVAVFRPRPRPIPSPLMTAVAWGRVLPCVACALDPTDAAIPSPSRLTEPFLVQSPQSSLGQCLEPVAALCPPTVGPRYSHHLRNRGWGGALVHFVIIIQ